ncbi:alpha/beta hydrolase [Guptibacillus algicola]|uniref:alpha/beta hydrolase n=1 Tax=Guptibacillus algicola TaxID=225844 RepID=UPI001CD65FE2|nr:alpha/beta hydrolase [Alkalihalobacillus algicola]MCA0987513.1 alpha/beta hydrolase [Alkalihalobacillus algicola]
MRQILQNNLPYYYFEAANVPSSKTIFIYHGFGSTAEGSFDLAETLANKGYSVVLPELIFHDSRNPFTNHFQPEIMQTYFWKTIFQSIDEFSSLVESIGLKKEQVILVGSSMGGFIANGIARKVAGLAGLVNVGGSGSFVLSETLFRESDGRSDIPSELLTSLKHYDPVERKSGNVPTLLLHGECDDIVSIQGQKDYYRFLIEGEARSNVTFRSYPSVGHEFTTDMVNDVVEWLHHR